MPFANDDTLATTAGTAADLALSTLLANDDDPDGDTLTVTAIGAAEHGDVVDNGDGTLTYSPDPGHVGTDAFTYTVSDGTDTDTATVAVTVAGPLVSDDFSGAATNGAAWQFEGSNGGSSVLTEDGQGLLRLTVPNGVNDAWGTLGVPRYMQAFAGGDFDVEIKFLSFPKQRTQMQGLVFEADENNWIRFDVLHDGNGLRMFAATTVDGVSERLLSGPVSEANATYLRVTRSSDDWTLRHSADGVTWRTASTFQSTLDVGAIGTFVANSSGAPGFSADIDYVFDRQSPLADDVTIPAPPTPGADVFSLRADTALDIDIAIDLLANDVDQNGDEVLFVSAGASGAGNVVDNGDGTLTYTPPSGFTGVDTFTYTVGDGIYEATQIVTVRVADLARSDDFAGGSLEPFWTYGGIAGFARVATTDTDAFLEIHSPQGVRVSASDNLTTPRLLQLVADTDFQLRARFLTEPSQQYQEHGFLVVQDDNNWLRFDLAYTGSTLTLIVGVIEDGNINYPLFRAVGSGAAEYLQVTRTGNDWVFEYSADGYDWTVAHRMSHAMFVTEAGLFAGSTSFTDAPPGYTAQVDFFENASAPIADEDDEPVPVNVAPLAGDDTFAVGRETPLVLDIASNLLANDSDGNGDPLAFDLVALPENGTLVDNADGTLTYVPADGFGGEDGFVYSVSDGTFTTDATVTINVADPIDVWYGDTQRFGQPGATQQWVNILGNVSLPNVVRLSYTLNGGPETDLVIGGDGRRLDRAGDFNIELDYADLDGSAAGDVLLITAEQADGTQISRAVTIDYEAGNRWAPNYAIDWSTVADLQSVVQVVDGYWDFDANGVTPLRPGYDRLLTLGDDGWDNYEVEMSVTAIDLQTTSPRHGGLFAIGFLWNGHTDFPVAGYDPHAGWENSAGFYFWGENEISIDRYAGWGGARQNLYQLSEDETYNLKIRVEQTGILDRMYSMKIWEQGQAEPTEWLAQTVDRLAAPTTGSLVLNSHFHSVVFGDLTVTEIEGSDTVTGRPGANVIQTVDTAQALPGLGEVDLLVGGGGADTFVLGDATRAFYDDGDATAEGLGDFALLWDYEIGVDRVMLHGQTEEYRITAAPTAVFDGTGLYRSGDNGPDELIAIFNTASPPTLADLDVLIA